MLNGIPNQFEMEIGVIKQKKWIIFKLFKCVHSEYNSVHVMYSEKLLLGLLGKYIADQNEMGEN